VAAAQRTPPTTTCRSRCVSAAARRVRYAPPARPLFPLLYSRSSPPLLYPHPYAPTLLSLEPRDRALARSLGGSVTGAPAPRAAEGGKKRAPPAGAKEPGWAKRRGRVGGSSGGEGVGEGVVKRSVKGGTPAGKDAPPENGSKGRGKARASHARAPRSPGPPRR
jgi:hypothetical protein